MAKKNLIWTWTFFLNLGSPDRQCDMYCDFVAKNSEIEGGWLLGSQVWVNGPQFGFFF